MQDCVVVFRREGLGDAICALPVIDELATMYDHVYLVHPHDDVLAIAAFPSNVVKCLQREIRPRPAENIMPVYFLELSPHTRRCQHLHPIDVFRAQCGLPIGGPLPKPYIAVRDEPAERYDVIIGPWSRDPQRALAPSIVTWLVRQLVYYRCAIIGHADAPVIPLTPCIYGEPLAQSVRLMQRARVVLTTDSMPNRLAHAVAQRHVLIQGCCSPEWVGYPGVTLVQTADEALDAVLLILQSS